MHLRISLCIIDLGEFGQSTCGRDIMRLCQVSMVHYYKAGGISCSFATHMYLTCITDLGTCKEPNYVALSKFTEDHHEAIEEFTCPGLPA